MQSLPLKPDGDANKAEYTSEGLSNIANKLDLTLQHPKQCSTLAKYKLEDEVIQAEILWCLNTVLQHNYTLWNAELVIVFFVKCSLIVL